MQVISTLFSTLASEWYSGVNWGPCHHSDMSSGCKWRRQPPGM